MILYEPKPALVCFNGRGGFARGSAFAGEGPRSECGNIFRKAAQIVNVEKSNRTFAVAAMMGGNSASLPHEALAALIGRETSGHAVTPLAIELQAQANGQARTGAPAPEWQSESFCSKVHITGSVYGRRCLEKQYPAAPRHRPPHARIPDLSTSNLLECLQSKSDATATPIRDRVRWR